MWIRILRQLLGFAGGRTPEGERYLDGVVDHADLACRQARHARCAGTNA